jgi:hypothetical protein
MKLVVYSNDNVRDSGGSFAVLVPTGELSFEATLAKDIPAGSEYKIVNASELEEMRKIFPTETQPVSYFSAWVSNLNNSETPIAFSIDMDKAKQIFADHLRTKRAKDLAALDIEYQKADEVGDVALKATIATKKQKLRDLPSDTRIVNCTDFDTLKTLTYEFLRDN